MLFLVLWLVALVAATMHVRLREERDPGQRAAIHVLYQLVLGFGVMGLITFSGHVFQPAQTEAGPAIAPA
jgi:hypothetical protein